MGHVCLRYPLGRQLLNIILRDIILRVSSRHHFGMLVNIAGRSADRVYRNFRNLEATLTLVFGLFGFMDMEYRLQ